MNSRLAQSEGGALGSPVSREKAWSAELQSSCGSGNGSGNGKGAHPAFSGLESPTRQSCRIKASSSAVMARRESPTPYCRSRSTAVAPEKLMRWDCPATEKLNITGLEASSVRSSSGVQLVLTLSLLPPEGT